MKKILDAAAITALLCIVIVIWNSILHQTMANAAEAADVPKYAVDPYWPKPIPVPWVTGEVGGTCVDAQDHVFIVSRGDLMPIEEKMIAQPAPPVIEFDPEGNIVNSWGNRDVLPERVHGCYIDYQNNFWLGGNGDHDGLVQKYTHDGSKLLLQIGKKGVVDSSDGTASGAPMNSSHTLLFKPAGIAVDSTNGDVYIADGYGNRRIVVFDRDGHYLRQWGKQGTVAESEAGVGGVFLKTVHCVVIGNDGLVYVCDRLGDRIEVFDKMGNFQRNIYIQKGTGRVTPIGSAWWLAFSRDPAQKFIYVADGGNEVIWILDHATGQILAGFGRPGHQVGDFTFLHTIALDSKGNLFEAEVVRGRRVQKFKLVGYQPAGVNIPKPIWVGSSQPLLETKPVE